MARPRKMRTTTPHALKAAKTPIATLDDWLTQQSTQEPMQELVLPADATNQLPLELPADAVLPADMPQQYPAVLPVEEQLIPDSEHK